MRVSLKELLFVLTFAAVMSWCAAVAYASEFFWMSVLVKFLVSAAFVGVARLEKRRVLAALVPLAPMALCALPIASIALLANLGLLLVAGVACAALPRPSTRALWAVAMVCAAAGYSGAALAGRGELRKFQALREEFPVVGLGGRLAYERGPQASLQPPQLSSAADVDLTKWEGQLEWSRNAWTSRARMLEDLHRRQYERFVQSAGFGVFRMARSSPEGVHLAPLRDIPFDETVQTAPYQSYQDRRAWWPAEARVPRDVEDLHSVSREDFLDAEGFGFVASRQEASGFLEHGMHGPKMSSEGWQAGWRLKRLELVSLLKFDEPRVYVLDHLPRMDQLSGDDVPTRSLDAFEADSLAKLEAGEDVVIGESRGATRMLGSLRAAKQCLDCHTAQRGELLGAFSYVLHRISKKVGE